MAIISSEIITKQKFAGQRLMIDGHKVVYQCKSCGQKEERVFNEKTPVPYSEEN